MKAEKVIRQETSFSENLTDINGTKFTIDSVEPITGAEIVKLNPGYNSYYYTAKYKKTKIVIHNTVGVLRSDIAAMTKPNWHVSVPFVIARDGTIYQLFDPSMWSYHLGKGAVGGNKTNSKSSIAIELSSYGPLKRVNDTLETMYSKITYKDSEGNSKTTGTDVYCTIDETQHYTELPVSYRGYKYFNGYTDAQLKSLNFLVDYLCVKFNIPKEILGESARYELFTSNKEAKVYTGICSHVNFIENGKWDIGPEMDWSYLFPNKEIVIDEPIEIKPNEVPVLVDEPIEKEPPVIPVSIKKDSILEILLNILKKILNR